jgi:hypothetical protein
VLEDAAVRPVSAAELLDDSGDVPELRVVAQEGA